MSHLIKLKTPDPKFKETFIDALRHILDVTKTKDQITLREIFHILAGKGYAALLIIFSFPFTFPIQIPGFSTPFGVILAFLGLRLAFSRKLWWPKWILEKKLDSKVVNALVNKTIKIVEYLQSFMRPRFLVLIKNPLIRCVHGLVIFILALLLSLPLPIPFTNMLCALPILSIGLGLLEDDGVFIIIGYFLALLCFGLFLGLFLLGKSQFI